MHAFPGLTIAVLRQQYLNAFWGLFSPRSDPGTSLFRGNADGAPGKASVRLESKSNR